MTPAVLEPISVPAPPSAATPVPLRLPTHQDLPDSDGAIVENFQESPQNVLLTGCLLPRLRHLHPDGRFAVGRDSGIYWRLTDPPLDGCRAPDFFVVLGVEPMLEGHIRRSYVMWQELLAPLIVIEYVSGDGTEERDRTPFRGKFWVYEHAIRAGYYLIFDGWRGTLEAYKKNGGGFHRMEPTAAGRFPVPELGVEFGLWAGFQETLDGVWLRPWDIATGELLPSFEEATAQQRQRADQADQRAEQERQRAEQADHRAEQADHRAEQEKQRAEQEKQRAEQERQRAERLAERMRQLGIDPEAV